MEAGTLPASAEAYHNNTERLATERALVPRPRSPYGRTG
jgi:hypothetical protein